MHLGVHRLQQAAEGKQRLQHDAMFARLQQAHARHAAQAGQASAQRLQHPQDGHAGQVGQVGQAISHDPHLQQASGSSSTSCVYWG
jgi:hypothetical protein